MAGGAATLIPFWPTPFGAGFAALAVVATYFRTRLGLAAALAVAVFPLGNLALGLALLYGAAAPAWLALSTWGPPALRRAVLTATGVIALHGLGPIDVAREESAVTAARAVAAAVPPEAWRVALALALAAATVTLLRTPWRVAFWGGALLGALLLPNPEIAALPVIAAVWACSVAVGARVAT